MPGTENVKKIRSICALAFVMNLAGTVVCQMPSSSAAPTLSPLGQKPSIISPLAQPTLSPGVILLMELEGRFAQAVAAGGGKAFSDWFADDGVTLNNGQLPVLGRAAIAAKAQWDPKEYQLTWVPEGAQMGPSNDMGFTWGHYEGRSKDKSGQPIVISGRYMTVWKKMPDGNWKVALDASANEPAAAGECCVVPKP
ncbi:YybH family protein [Edaphobacter flagellatus]|uniref:YybH family protein n=1 Tax=Edaphobacter flagellatus TaxID=1933044 RepID=UPI0021B1C3B3|nr:nuclear transport factor 2 family protein [Edaphobacter flagellatus]